LVPAAALGDDGTPEVVMDAKLISFGVIEIDGQRFEYDVVLDQGVVRKRKKGPSKPHRERYGHTPLSVEEAIPWSAPVLIIGTGASGQLPVMPELYEEARRRGVEVVVEPTSDACQRLRSVDPKDVSAILHVTC
jgi:hypothetical protein